MAGEGVKIPVSVTGGAAAAAELQRVGQAAQQAAQQVAAAQSGGDWSGGLGLVGRSDVSAPSRAAGSIASGGGIDFATYGREQEVQSKRTAEELLREAQAADRAGASIKGAGEQHAALSAKSKMLALDLVNRLNPELGEAARLGFHLTSGLAGISPALLGIVAAAAGISFLVSELRSVYEAADQAAEAMTRANAANTEWRTKRAAETAGIGKVLAESGALSDENTKAALLLRERLSKNWRVGEEDAGKLAPLAVAAGLSEEDAARASVLMRGGARVEKAGDIGKLLGMAKGSPAYAGLLDQARKWATGPGTGELSPEEILLQRYKETGLEKLGLPSDLDAAKIREIRDARALAESMETTVGGANGVPLNKYKGPTWGRRKEYRNARDLADQYGWVAKEYEQEAKRQLEGPPVPSTQPAGSGPIPEQKPAQQVINNYNTTNINNINTQVRSGARLEDMTRQVELTEAGGGVLD